MHRTRTTTRHCPQLSSFFARRIGPRATRRYGSIDSQTASLNGDALVDKRCCWPAGTDPGNNRRRDRKTYPDTGPASQSCRTLRQKSRPCDNTHPADACVAIATEANTLSAVIGAALNFKKLLHLFSLCFLCAVFVLVSVLKSRWDALDRRVSRAGKNKGILCAGLQKIKMHHPAGALKYDHHSLPCMATLRRSRSACSV